MNNEAFLATHSVFSFEDMWYALGEQVTRKAVAARLQYLKHKNRVLNLCRGIYATIPYGANPRTYDPDRYLVMHALRSDSIFCGHSALELNGVAYSVWNVCTAYTEGCFVELQIRGITYRALYNRAPIIRSNQLHLGVQRVYRREQELRVLGPERILVEGLQDPSHYGEYEELLESILGFSHFDMDLLMQVADVFDQSRVYALLGWFLEWKQEHFSVPDNFLEALQNKITFPTHHLGHRERESIYYKRWRLRVPKYLLQAGEIY